MELQLSVSSAQAKSLGREAKVIFRLRGGTIGRSQGNDWVLPDPERILSKRHARIHYDRGQYFIEDMSTNGIFLNQTDRPIPRGQPQPLHHGDLLYLVEYEIQVALLDTETRPESQGVFHPESPSTPPSAFIPEPYELGTPLPGGAQGRATWPESPPTPPAPPFEGDGGPSRSDHLPDDRQHFRPPEAMPEAIPEGPLPPVEEVLPDDWWRTGERDIPDSSELPSTEEYPLAEATSVPEPVDAQAETGALPTRPADDGSPGPVPPDPEALIQALFAGLGLPPQSLSPEAQVALLNQTGRLLRRITQGLLEILRARASLKGEFRLSQTIVRPAENNPLKFALTTEQALEQLFFEKQPGFLGAEEAFAQALDDLKHHEIAVIAGMRAAFEGVIEKLSPESVEAAYQASEHRMHLFGKHLWAFYRTYHAAFKADANDDFHGIFGEDFVRAYEKQIAQLTSEKAADHE